MSGLVGKKAPEFNATVVINNQIVENYTLSGLAGQYVILFFYPLDFTFVCPTELHAFQEKLFEFRRRNCEVVGCSVDSAYSHLAWLNTPKAKGGIAGVQYPLIADLNKTIARDYNVLINSQGIAYRGLFLIDKEGVVRHETINDLPIGRSVDETLRILDAWIYFENNGEVCPANWKPGNQGFKPTEAGIQSYFAGQNEE